MIGVGELAQAEALLHACRDARLKIATVESCTGGLIVATLTAIAGSSDVVDRGFVTYSNAAKSEQVGVPPALIEAFGAVSEAVARSMAEGALRHSAADLAVSVTGIAGPDGGSDEKPVGLVWFGLARRGRSPETLRAVFPGDRREVRRATVARAMELLRSAI